MEKGWGGTKPLMIHYWTEGGTEPLMVWYRHSTGTGQYNSMPLQAS